MQVEVGVSVDAVSSAEETVAVEVYDDQGCAAAPCVNRVEADVVNTYLKDNNLAQHWYQSIINSMKYPVTLISFCFPNTRSGYFLVSHHQKRIV